MPAPSPFPIVYFLSDYGTHDEFVGVVHAVVVAQAPGATMVDLTHHIPAFDAAAGSRTLVRAVPHLGPGVVLAVVDPGVGTARLGVCIEVALEARGTMHFVGPDNGLLVEAAELVAGGRPLDSVVALPSPSVRSTFDGRDVFAPAAGALCRGVPLGELGDPVDPAGLVRLPAALLERTVDPGGRSALRAEVIWVDTFGNVQLGATEVDVPDGVAVGLTRAEGETTLRRVSAFGELAPGEVGLLCDANGRLAIVAGQASAASRLGLLVGSQITLTW
ncbi:MAG TPA: SAM-dependent chlorinase/fluorinase [Acidimicrobiales bacterium]|jgi:hypothetical protein|nr:SAM-dependent chlorinase/fluorinase [Acidimicrobiales bacterium]